MSENNSQLNDRQISQLKFFDKRLMTKLGELQNFENAIQSFDTEELFKYITNSSGIDQPLVTDSYREAVVEKLQQYIPPIYEALAQRRFVKSKSKLYNCWINFLIEKKTDPNKIVDTAMSYADHWVSNELNDSQYDTAYQLFSTAIFVMEHMNTHAISEEEDFYPLDMVSRENYDKISEFIVTYSKDLLPRYATTTSNGLDLSSEQIQTEQEKKQKERKKYYSYAYEAVDTYCDILNLSLRVMPEDMMASYIDDMYPKMKSATSHAMNGYVVAVKGQEPRLLPDVETRNKLLSYSLTTAQIFLKERDFHGFIFEEVPDLLDESAKYSNKDLCCDLCAHTISLIEDKTFKGTFIRTIAASALRTLAEPQPQQAAKLMIVLRDHLGANDEEAFILSNKSVKDNGVPLMVLTNKFQIRENILNVDLAALLLNAGDVTLGNYKEPYNYGFVRDRMAGQKDFQKLTASQKLGEPQLQLALDTLKDAVTLNIDSPKIKHYGDYLHSCPMHLLPR